MSKRIRMMKVFKSSVDFGKTDIKTKDGEYPLCPKCNHARWKTVEKGKQYRCKRCDFIKEV